jgi:hypothetical protein
MILSNPAADALRRFLPSIIDHNPPVKAIFIFHNVSIESNESRVGASILRMKAKQGRSMSHAARRQDL